MENIEPDSELMLLPEETKVVRFAEQQPEYVTLPSLKTPKGAVVSFWRPSAGELEMLKSGAPIVLTLLTFNQPLQPIMLTVGGQDLREY